VKTSLGLELLAIMGDNRIGAIRRGETTAIGAKTPVFLTLYVLGFSFKFATLSDAFAQIPFNLRVFATLSK
jgi:hypothetical protein